MPCVEMTEGIHAPVPGARPHFDALAAALDLARRFHFGARGDQAETGAGPAHAPWAAPVVLWLLLAMTFLIRAYDAGQPIVENYVGRQVPTATVARNLERGSGFFKPRLDTAPFPNFFLVEPPLFQCGVIGLKRLTGLGLEPAGRLVSALATTLAAWGLFTLARPRSSTRAALFAVLAFAVFPLTIRFGRAFQPDAAMLGAVVAGLASWDRYRATRHWCWACAGWILLAAAFALKIIVAFLLAPLVLSIAPCRRARDRCTPFSTLIPALLWYAWAAYLISGTEGSRASSDNRAIWMSLLVPSALFRAETVRLVAWFVLVRAFTPLGALLALHGLVVARWRDTERPALWWIWAGSTLVAMAILAEKLHHEYYWLALAPAAAAGVGYSLDNLARRRAGAAIALAVALCCLCGFQARSTWRTPPEWSDLESAARDVSRLVPSEAWVVAPEALLFEADRRGCRMEWTNQAARRAAGEWGGPADVTTPLDLVEFYRRHGARYFADLGAREYNHERKGLHDSIRRRYKVIEDRPHAIIADLHDPEIH